MKDTDYHSKHGPLDEVMLVICLPEEKPARTPPKLALLCLVLFLALTLRLMLCFVPPLSNALPRGYRRAADYAEAAHNVLCGRGPVQDAAKLERIYAEWGESGNRLPRSIEEYPDSPEPEFMPMVVEKGYLLVTVILGKITGHVSWASVLVLQCLLSTACAGLLFGIAPYYALHPRAPLIAGLCYALSPLELLISTYPDLVVWAVYASVVALCLLGFEWDFRKPKHLLVVFCGGVFLGLCLLIRANNIGTVGVILLGLLYLHRRRSTVLIGILTMGIVVGTLPSFLFLRAGDVTEPVGNSNPFHNLLGGLAEFGDVEHLAYDDETITKWIRAKGHAIDYDPARPIGLVAQRTGIYNQACKDEYFKLLEDRPLLPLLIAAKRAGRFVIGYRPGRETPPILVAATLFKVFFVVGLIGLIRAARDPAMRRRVVCFVAITSVSVLIYLPIAPLLVMYIAPSLILGLLIAAYGLPVMRRILSRGTREEGPTCIGADNT